MPTNRRKLLAAAGSIGTITATAGCLDFLGLGSGSDSNSGTEANADDVNETGGGGNDTEALTQQNNTSESNGSDQLEDANQSNETDTTPDENQSSGSGGNETGEVGTNQSAESEITDVTDQGDNPLQIVDRTKRVDTSEYGDDQLTVTGTVENTGSETYQRVTAELIVYDDAGEELGRSRDLTPELAPGETWRFEISPIQSAAEISQYEVVVTGE